MTTQTRTAENGVNVAALLGARTALSGAPEAARFKWRASSEWLKGTHSRATVDGFFGLSSIAICAPRRDSPPEYASAPVTGCRTPIFTSPDWPRTIAGKPARPAAVSAAERCRNSRRCFPSYRLP